MVAKISVAVWQDTIPYNSFVVTLLSKAPQPIHELQKYLVYVPVKIYLVYVPVKISLFIINFLLDLK
jgi:hypothetical protein